MVWAVDKGSFLNKLIHVPSALLISAILLALIIPLLICGALFLCFEGFESVWHFLYKKRTPTINL
ncbi:MAG: putative DNA repair protein MutK [Cellvibrionaceae bacterium]|jgi:predicted DNA repair protein MutK